MFGFAGNASRPVLKWDDQRADSYQTPDIRIQTYYDDASSSYRQQVQVYCYFSAIASAGDVVVLQGLQNTTAGSTCVKYQPAAVLTTTAVALAYQGIVLKTMAAAAWGWVAVQGYVDGVFCNTSVAAGDLIECSGNMALGINLAGGATGSTVFAQDTIGIATGTGTKNTRDGEIFLFGRLVNVQNT